MDKIPSETSSTNEPGMSTTTEARTLREVVYSAKRIGGNYGSLAKAQTQPIYYISHKVESDDTLQRLSLKYSINIQDIKRVNKLWSDSELGLLPHVYIPVNSTQLSTLRNVYPDLNVVQSLSPLMTHLPKSSTTPNIEDTTTSSESSNSYQDYFSKIDQQIQLTKKSLQSLDIKDPHESSQLNNISKTNSPNNERHKGVHHLSDNSVFVNIATQNSRDKHVSAALKRIQREKDNFDEL